MPDVARALDLLSGQPFGYWKHVPSNKFVPLEVWFPRDMLGLPGAPGGLATLIGPFLVQVADLLDEVRNGPARLPCRGVLSRSSGVRWRARRAAPRNVSMAE